MAHVTGGGIAGNLVRILGRRVDARIELGNLRVPPLFGAIMRAGRVGLADMMRTFNMGAGMLVVAKRSVTNALLKRFAARGYRSYPLGEIVPGHGRVRMSGTPEI